MSKIKINNFTIDKAVLVVWTLFYMISLHQVERMKIISSHEDLKFPLIYQTYAGWLRTQVLPISFCFCARQMCNQMNNLVSERVISLICVSHAQVCWALPEVTDFTFPKQLGTMVSRKDSWEMHCHKSWVALCDCLWYSKPGIRISASFPVLSTSRGKTLLSIVQHGPEKSHHCLATFWEIQESMFRNLVFHFCRSARPNKTAFMRLWLLDWLIFTMTKGAC